MARIDFNSLFGGPGVGSMMPGQVASSYSRGGGSNQSTINALIASMQQSQQAANSAGEDRYKQLMETVASLQQSVLGEGGTYQTALEMIQNQGQGARARVGEQKVKSLAGSEQDLISRGLGNTTVRSSVQRGIKKDAERSMLDIDEGIARDLAGLLERRAGFETQLGQFKADALLSRQDQGPQMSQYLNLIAALAG